MKRRDFLKGIAAAMFAPAIAAQLPGEVDDLAEEMARLDVKIARRFRQRNEDIARLIREYPERALRDIHERITKQLTLGVSDESQRHR